MTGIIAMIGTVRISRAAGLTSPPSRGDAQASVAPSTPARMPRAKPVPARRSVCHASTE